MYNISVGLGRVASIYHGTIRRECYQMLLISLRHIVTCACVAWAMSAGVYVSDTELPV